MSSLALMRAFVVALIIAGLGMAVSRDEPVENIPVDEHCVTSFECGWNSCFRTDLGEFVRQLDIDLEAALTQVGRVIVTAFNNLDSF